MDTTVLVALVGGGSAVAGALVAGAVSVYIAKRQGKSQDATAQAAAVAAEAAVQDTIYAGFAALTAQYERRNADLLQQNEALEAKLDEALEKLDEALSRADQVTGEMRDLTQHVESLESALRRLGHDIPQRKRPHPMAKPPLAVIPDPDKPNAG